MQSSQKTFLFAAVMCIVCGVILTAIATSLKPMQDRNIKINKQKNILIAFGVVKSGQKVSNDDVESLYKTNVIQKCVNTSGEFVKNTDSDCLSLYLLTEGNRIKKYAVPISGAGLWSTIYGYLAINADGETVEGITFYQHGETPGLGGEVEKDWFQNQFPGKKIVDRNGNFVSVGVIKGKVADKIAEDKRQHYVDGISGATITANGVDSFIKSDLKKYEPFSIRLRNREKLQLSGETR